MTTSLVMQAAAAIAVLVVLVPLLIVALISRV